MNLFAPFLPPAPPDLLRLALAQMSLPDDGSKWIVIGGAMLLIT